MMNNLLNNVLCEWKKWESKMRSKIIHSLQKFLWLKSFFDFRKNPQLIGTFLNYVITYLQNLNSQSILFSWLSPSSKRKDPFFFFILTGSSSINSYPDFRAAISRCSEMFPFTFRIGSAISSSYLTFSSPNLYSPIV